jgi:hypothetical protein
VAAVSGRLHAGNEQPVVAIDPAPGPGVRGVPGQIQRPAALADLAADLAEPSSRDLAALLRYEGAVDPAPGKAVEAAPEILVMPFWTPEFCATLVRAAEVAGMWASDPDDPVPGAEVSLFALSPRLAGLLEEDLVARVWPRLHEHWPEAAATGLHDAFVIRYEPGGPTEGLPLHHDVAQVSATAASTRATGVGRWPSPARAGTPPVSPSAIWWPGRRSSPTPTGPSPSTTVSAMA